jgi:hypothetical protein
MHPGNSSLTIGFWHSLGRSHTANHEQGGSQHPLHEEIHRLNLGHAANNHEHYVQEQLAATGTDSAHAVVRAQYEKPAVQLKVTSAAAEPE